MRKVLVISGFALAICSAFYDDNTIPQGLELYEQNCSSCHDITREATGPPLYKKREYRDTNWIYSFVSNYAKMVAEHDTEAVIIHMYYGRTAMPAFPSLSRNEIIQILDYIDSAGTGTGVFPHRQLTKEERLSYYRNFLNDDSMYQSYENDSNYLRFIDSVSK